MLIGPKDMWGEKERIVFKTSSGLDGVKMIET